jgi:hypothetical protein
MTGTPGPTYGGGNIWSLKIPNGGYGIYNMERTRQLFSQFEEVSIVSFILDNFVSQ